MESFYSSVGLMMDAIGMVLSLILIYNRYYFHSNNERNALHTIPYAVFLVCFFEFLNYPLRAHSLTVIFLILQYVEAILECALVAFTIQYMVENLPFYDRFKVKITYRRNFICCFLIVAASVLVQVLMNDRDAGFVIDYQMIFTGRWVLFGVMIYLMLVLLLQSIVAKDRDTFFQVLTLLLCCALTVIAAELEIALITKDWTGDGLGYALGYTLLYSIASTKLMMASKEKQATLMADVNMARNIQQDALPKEMPAFPHHTGISVNAMMTTAKDVGGDFYDYFEIDDHRVCFLIADVSGKGMPASLFMMTAKTTLRTIALTAKSTAEIIDRSNRLLAANNASLMFVTVWIGILNTETLEIEYTNAAHNPPVVIHGDGSLEVLHDAHGTILGVRSNAHYGKGSFKAQAKDRLFLYTDGIPEAHNSLDELFGEERMLKGLREGKDLDGGALVKDMQGRVEAFGKGREPFDDVTMMVVDIGSSDSAEDAFDPMDFLENL